MRATVQPAASAGETFRVIIDMGKFHGVIAATTPTGALTTSFESEISGRGRGAWRTC